MFLTLSYFILDQPVNKKPRLGLITYQRSRAEASANDSADVPADVKLTKYLAAINQDDFSSDEHPVFFASKEYCYG